MTPRKKSQNDQTWLPGSSGISPRHLRPPDTFDYGGDEDGRRRWASGGRLCPPRRGLPSSIESRIAKVPHDLTRLVGLRAGEAEDIAQDLRLAIIIADRKYDATRGSYAAVCSGVLQLARLHLYRELRRRRDARSVITHWPSPPVEFEGQLGEPRSVTDLRLDIQPVIESLDHEDYALVQALETMTIAEYAAKIGVHRSTLYRRLERIQQLITARLGEEIL